MKTKDFSIHEAPLNIRCVMYSGEAAPRHIVLCCHGFSGSKDTRSAARFAEYMLPKYKDMAVISFDWPCHGEDVRKKLTLSDCGAYLSAVIRWIKENLRPQTLDGYATSFGGYLTIKYAAEHGTPFRLLALRCPAVNMHEVLSAMLTDTDRALIAKGKDAPVGFERKGFRPTGAEDGDEIEMALYLERAHRERPMRFENAYFITGNAYAGKSTMVKLLAKRHGSVLCGENWHDEYPMRLDTSEFPALTYTRDLEDWHDFIRRTPEEYNAWIERVQKECEILELRMLPEKCAERVCRLKKYLPCCSPR